MQRQVGLGEALPLLRAGSRKASRWKVKCFPPTATEVSVGNFMTSCQVCLGCVKQHRSIRISGGDTTCSGASRCKWLRLILCSDPPFHRSPPSVQIIRTNFVPHDRVGVEMENNTRPWCARPGRVKELVLDLFFF